MSSGHGLNGGVSRCYPFFAEFKECLVRFIGRRPAGGAVIAVTFSNWSTSTAHMLISSLIVKCVI